MTVASRYLNREIAAIFTVTLLMLLLVAVGGRFIGYLQEAALGKFTGSTVLMIIALRLPEFVQLVAPFAIYVAIVLSLGRMHAEHEMVVLQGAGVSTANILQWISISLVTVIIFVGLFALVLTPLSQRVLVDFLAEQRAASEFEALNPGTFHIYDYGRRVTYSQAMSDDRRVLYDVFLSHRLDNGAQVNIWAENGSQSVDELSGSHFLILNNGRRYESSPDTQNLRIMEFGQLRQRLDTAPRRSGRVDVEALATQDLGSDPESAAQWHWRLGLPVFTAIGGLLALGISKVKPRQGRFARVVPGMVMMLLYYLALLVNQNAIVEQQIPSQLGLWSVHAAFLGIAIWLNQRLAKPV